MEQVQDADVLLVNSGYFDPTILDWLEGRVAALIARGGEAHFAIGSNSGQTARAGLERLLELVAPGMPARASISVIYVPGSIYHPKIYFARRKDWVCALIGSPNFTVASSTVNIEAAIVLEAETNESPLDAIEAASRPAAILALPNAYSIGTSRDLDLLANMGVIDLPRVPAPRAGRPATRHAARLRRLARFPSGTAIIGTPAAVSRRPAVVVPPPATVGPSIRPGGPAASIVIFVFSPNDLKLTGTRELSVPEGVRAWAAGVLGAPISVGQGTLMEVELWARLGWTPNAVETSPERVRLWSAGASGGTHGDVRFGMGTYLRAALEDQSIAQYGDGLQGGDIGILELPADPVRSPIRLTIFRPPDPEFSILDGMAVRTGRQQKRQAVVTTLPLLPPWPY
jgi:NgoFVII-like restriction endonuclease